jgi:hypothetical protein
VQRPRASVAQPPLPTCHAACSKANNRRTRSMYLFFGWYRRKSPCGGRYCAVGGRFPLLFALRGCHFYGKISWKTAQNRAE